MSRRSYLLKAKPKGTTMGEGCRGCLPAPSQALYARLGAANPTWSGIRLHDRACIEAAKGYNQ